MLVQVSWTHATICRGGVATVQCERLAVFGAVVHSGIFARRHDVRTCDHPHVAHDADASSSLHYSALQVLVLRSVSNLSRRCTSSVSLQAFLTRHHRVAVSPLQWSAMCFGFLPVTCVANKRLCCAQAPDTFIKGAARVA